MKPQPALAMASGSSVAGAALLPGWLRTPSFDLGFIVGVAAVALLSGWLVVLDPRLFKPILLCDLWLLGYHHVVATFTRLAFDSESFRQHRFLVVGLPLLVLGATAGLYAVAGAWALTTTYLYWQWFHYTRQSYGVMRIYARKAGVTVGPSQRIMTWMLYALPIWGILYRSAQRPSTFLGVELRVLPVPEPVLLVASSVAIATLIVWAWREVVDVRQGRQHPALTLYLASHVVVFSVGYLLIDQIEVGWLVLNVWHNAQYVLLVWMYNNNRFHDRVDVQHRLLSMMSRRRAMLLYFAVCLGISTLLYASLRSSLLLAGATLPLILIIYQTINFHHYIVDGLIWRIRSKAVQRPLGLAA